MTRLPAISFAILLGLCCQAATAGAPQYLVEMELWLDGRPEDAPTMVVEAGSPAMLERADEQGENGWRIELQVEPPAESEGAPEGAIWLELAVHRLEKGQWDHLADSILGVPEGQSSVLSVAADPELPATPENSQVYLRISTSRLRREVAQ